MNLDDVKILIGIPTQEFARAAIFYDYIDSLIKPGLTWITRVHGQSPASNRNTIIKQALERDVEYVFFVDDDCLLPPDTLIKLLNHDKDMVTGLYPMRNFPHRPIIFDQALDDGRCIWHELEDNEGGLVPVEAAGAGCLLVKRHVLEKVAEAYRHPFTLGELEPDQWCDDLSFFKHTRSLGFKLYCDLSAPVGHIAKVTVWPNKINNQWAITYDSAGSDVVNVRMLRPNQPTNSKLPRMKAPGDIRPTWRNGIIQVHVTRACDLSCTGCTQGSNLAGKPVMMSLENFEAAVKSLRDYYGVVGIFGGNPTLHPQFDKLCEIFEDHIPFERRGLWSNNLNGYGDLIRRVFNPRVSNINVHGEVKALNEVRNFWPEVLDDYGRNFKGMEQSRHSPPFVAMKDMKNLSEEDMWKLIGSCDINKYWSAMVCQFRGELRGFFCELAGAQSMLHEHEEDYPDTGIKIEDGWWNLPITKFEHQIEKHCPECGIPLRGKGDLDNGSTEYVSVSHLPVYKLKKAAGKTLKLINYTNELDGNVQTVTEYVSNGQLV